MSISHRGYDSHCSIHQKCVIIMVHAEREHPGSLGLSILDDKNGESWQINGGMQCPMMSVIKLPVATAVLSLVDARKLTLEQSVRLSSKDRVEGSAVRSIGNRIGPLSLAVTVRDLLRASVSQSDNTSVDVLLRLVGGTDTVTHFLSVYGIRNVIVNMNERGMKQWFENEARALKACGSLSPQAADACVVRRRDNRSIPSPATAIDMTLLLWKLSNGELLSSSSTSFLLGFMYSQTIPHRLRDGAPQGVRVADKTGTGGRLGGATYAWNDVAIVTWPNRQRIFIAAFLTNSEATDDEKNRSFADITRTIADNQRGL